MAKSEKAKAPAKKASATSVSKPAAKAAKGVKAGEETPFVQHQTSLKPGQKAPLFEALDQDGNSVRLQDFSGKTLILYFYPKDNTPGCTNEACSLRDEYHFLGKKNYAVVGVSADGVKSHKKFASKFDLPFPLLADEDMRIIKAYDVWGTKKFMGRIYDGILRTTFVIDGKGIIERVITEVKTKEHAQQILEG